jgi:hypothetical protein
MSTNEAFSLSSYTVESKYFHAFNITSLSMHSCFPSWFIDVFPKTLKHNSCTFCLWTSLNISATYLEEMILLNVAIAYLPSMGSIPWSLNVRLANASSNLIKYIPSSLFKDFASLECLMKEWIIASAHPDYTILTHPSSL